MRPVSLRRQDQYHRYHAARGVIPFLMAAVILMILMLALGVLMVILVRLMARLILILYLLAGSRFWQC